MRSLRPGLFASAALALALAAGPGLAQTAAPDDLTLRGGDAAALPAAADDGLPDLDATPSPDAAPPARAAKSKSLPPLEPYPRARAVRLRGTDGGNAAPGPTVAALPPAPARRQIRREDSPFAPVGLYVGDLKLTPYFEQSLGYASNPLGVSGAARGSALSTTEVGVGLQSNWSRNELSGAAKLGYNEYFQLPGASAPYGSGNLDYRYDISRDLSIDTEGRFNVASQTNAQLGLGAASSNSTSNVLLSTYGATLGGVNKFGDLSIGLHGTVDRVQYSGGDYATDDYNDYGLKLRASYRLSEAVSPFAEVDGDTRMYDDKVDAGGYDRASNGVTGLAGLRMSFSELLSGEVSAGYGARAYRDPQLPDASAPLFNASLIWTPTALTTVSFAASSQLQDAIATGASADINHSYTINVSHALTPRITLGVNGGFSTDDYVGANQNDRTYTLGASAEYHLSRDVVLKASATHTRFASDLPGSSYNADTVLLGVRLQR